MAKIGRNDPCPCGAGKKYKKCCLPLDEAAGRMRTFRAGSASSIGETLAVQNSDRPLIQTMCKGKRFRAVGSRVYVNRRPNETFHEFIWALLKTELREAWYLAEVKKAPAERHQIVQWFFDLYEWQKATKRPEHQEGEVWGAPPSGNVQALTSLAYDVYTLSHEQALPKELVRRLTDRHEFQGARYEVAVAAICCRAGFSLRFLEEDGKHCEFLATHKRSGEIIGVEAKSRRRSGVLHEKGTLDPNAVLRGNVQRLFEDARAQAPPGKPFVIFVDLNCPPDGDLPYPEKKWWGDIGEVFHTHDVIQAGKDERHDVFNAVVITNFATHYFGHAAAPSTGERVLVKSVRSKWPVADEAMMDLWNAVNRYGTFPMDVDYEGL